MKDLPSNYNYSMGPWEYDKIMCKTSERIKFIDEELGNLKYR